MLNKRLINTGEAAAAALDPLQNFETVTYTGNGSTQKITGYIRKGAAFNGSSSNITTPFNISNIVSNINDRTQDFSISLWINPSVIPSSGNDVIFYVGNYNVYSPQYHAILLKLQNGNTIFTVYDGVEYNASTSSVTINNWYHISCVRESSVLKLYVNGSLVDSVTQSGDTAISSSATLKIGQTYSASDHYNGKIDQVRIFNKALSSGEVTTLYGETYASTTKSTTDIFGDGSGVALYELDEDANDTGGTYNGTATNVNYLGMAFQPDLVWTKGRNNSWNNILADSVRGFNGSNVWYLASDTTDAQFDRAGLSSFDSNGFSLGSYPTANNNGNTYVAWCWKAGGAAVSNTDGTITSQVSANQDAGFSIVKYNYTQSASSFTIGHGLSSAPELIILKAYDTTSTWLVYSPIGTNKELYLNSSSQAGTDAGRWANTAPTDSVFTIGTSFNYPDYAGDTIAYCFHSVDGYQRIGSYSGTGTAGKEVTGLGFSPRFVMIKDSTQAGHWIIHSKPPTTTNPSVYHLRANLSAQEDGGTGEQIDFDDDGFTLNGTGGNVNTLNDVYIYLAIA